MATVLPIANHTFTEERNPEVERLCFLQYEGYHLKHPNAYRQLVNEPAAVCDRCGRTARNRTNLCDPTHLG